MDNFWIELLFLVFGMPPFLAICHWMHRKKWERLARHSPRLLRLSGYVNKVACAAIYFGACCLFWAGWNEQRFFSSHPSQVRAVVCNEEPLAHPDLIVRAFRETKYGIGRSQEDQPAGWTWLELRLSDGNSKCYRVGRFRDGKVGIDAAGQTLENDQLLAAFKANGVDP